LGSQWKPSACDLRSCRRTFCERRLVESTCAQRRGTWPLLPRGRCGFPTCYSAGLTLGQRHAHSPSPTQPSRFPDSQSQSRGPQSPRARSLPAHAMIIIGGSLSTALVMSAARRQGTPDALGTCRGINAAASLARRRLASPRPGHPFHRAAGGSGWPRRKPGGSHRRELAASFCLGERGRHSTFHITTWQWHMR